MNGTIDKTKVVCSICQAEFSYHRSSSSLTYHLNAKHPTESRSGLDGRQSTLHFSTKITRPVREKVTNALAVWVARDCRPINIVEDGGLTEVIRIASGDNSYDLPSRGTIVSRIHSLYDGERARKMQLLEQAASVALTGDHWTSVSNDNYLGVTAHFIDNEWKLRSFALEVKKTEGRHTAENCAEEFLDVANRWEISGKLSTLGTDSARNMVAAARLLPFQHLPCAAHSLQRTITVALKDSGFENVLAKCRKIVGHFRHSPSNDRELRAQQTAEGQQEESLVQDVATRWNSALEMIKRIQQNKGPLAATLAQQKTTISMLTAPELAKLEKLEQVLEPCRHVTELLGGEQYVSCSVVLPALCHLSRVMESSDDDPIYVVKFKDTFTADHANRKENTNLEMLKIATLCDPRFKDLKCLPKEERCEVWALLRNLMQEDKGGMRSAPVRRETEDPKKQRMSPFLLASSDTDSEEEEEESISKALDRYRAEPKMQMGDCPLNWWSGRQHTHEKLAGIAKKHLSTPATTVPCERLFSLSGHIVQKRRAALAPENVNMLVCLSNWLKVKED